MTDGDRLTMVLIFIMVYAVLKLLIDWNTE
jgi:hypothetical protein